MKGKDLEAPRGVLEYALQVGMQSKLLRVQVLLWTPALQTQRLQHPILIQSASAVEGWHSWTSRPRTNRCLGEGPLRRARRTQAIWTLGSSDWQLGECRGTTG